MCHSAEQCLRWEGHDAAAAGVPCSVTYCLRTPFRSIMLQECLQHHEKVLTEREGAAQTHLVRPVLWNGSLWALHTARSLSSFEMSKKISRRACGMQLCRGGAGLLQRAALHTFCIAFRIGRQARFSTCLGTCTATPVQPVHYPAAVLSGCRFPAPLGSPGLITTACSSHAR